MTQIVSLSTGSMQTSGSTKVNASELTKEASLSFADLMSQNTKDSFDPKTKSIENGQLDVASDSKAGQSDAEDSDYASLRSNRSIEKADSVKNEQTDSAWNEKVQKLADDVKEAAADTLGVTEEELTDAMELLGLTQLDLLQPQNLMQLAQTLIGNEDVSALLTNESVQQLLGEVGDLFTEFKQQNVLSNQAFSELLTQLPETNQLAIEPEAMPQTDEQMNFSENLQMDELQTRVLDANTEASDTIKSMEETAAPADAKERTLQTQSGQTDVSEQSLQLSDTEPVTQNMTGDSSEDLADGDSDAQLKSTVKNDQTGSGEDTVADDSFDFTEKDSEPLGQETMNTQQTMNMQQTAQLSEATLTDVQTRYESLMNQMEGLARAFASSEGTTLQMQLNPENLGRLVLTVSERHGNVTAQITATNEEVKEALQTQLAQLHTTLQAQGIRVDAVEVTVASHEFEQNLDGNASANGQMADQDNGSSGDRSGSGRRNIDRSMLQGIEDALNEEEALAANLMRDNGGSVDYTA